MEYLNLSDFNKALSSFDAGIEELNGLAKQAFLGPEAGAAVAPAPQGGQPMPPQGAPQGAPMGPDGQPMPPEAAMAAGAPPAPEQVMAPPPEAAAPQGGPSPQLEQMLAQLAQGVQNMGPVVEKHESDLGLMQERLLQLEKKIGEYESVLKQPSGFEGAAHQKPMPADPSAAPAGNQL